MSQFQIPAVCEGVRFWSHHIDPVTSNVPGVLTVASGHTNGGAPQQEFQFVVDTSANALTVTTQAAGPSPLVNCFSVLPSGALDMKGNSISNVDGLSITGDISVADITATGAINAATVTTSGDITTSQKVLSTSLSSSNIECLGPFTAQTIACSGAVTAANVLPTPVSEVILQQDATNDYAATGTASGAWPSAGYGVFNKFQSPSGNFTATPSGGLYTNFTCAASGLYHLRMDYNAVGVPYYNDGQTPKAGYGLALKDLGRNAMVGLWSGGGGGADFMAHLTAGESYHVSGAFATSVGLSNPANGNVGLTLTATRLVPM
jgi:hypothetical protein